jgi:hypothetical protein
MFKKPTFIVKTRVRSYQLFAPDQEEMTQWIAKLNACIDVTPDLARALASPDFFKSNEKEGWLTKAAPELENWKKRWFILKEGFLYYFKSAASSPPLGAIALQDSHIELDERTGKKNCFCIQTRHRRVRFSSLAWNDFR